MHPVAFAYGLTAKGVFHSIKVGYDRDFAEQLPGQLLRYYLLERFFADPERKALDFQGPMTEGPRRLAARAIHDRPLGGRSAWDGPAGWPCGHTGAFGRADSGLLSTHRENNAMFSGRRLRRPSLGLAAAGTAACNRDTGASTCRSAAKQSLLSLGSGVGSGGSSTVMRVAFAAARSPSVAAPPSKPGTLANSLQAEMVCPELVRIEADAPIPHLDSHPAVGLPNSTRTFSAPAVAAGVGQAFLHDAEDGDFQRRGQPVKLLRVDELDFRAAALLLLGDQVVDGGHDARLVEHRRPQTADQPRALAHRLAEQPHRLLEHFGRRGLGVAVAQSLDDWNLYSARSIAGPGRRGFRRPPVFRSRSCKSSKSRN